MADKAKQVLVDRIVGGLLKQMKQGVVPWRKPWCAVEGDGFEPLSFSTRKPYRGSNLVWLAIERLVQGYRSRVWVTFRQAKQAGGSVRKGEHGTVVVLWKPGKRTVTEGGEDKEKRFLLMRYFTVFNLDQTEGLEAPWAAEAAPALGEVDWSPEKRAEALLAAFLDEDRQGGEPETMEHGVGPVRLVEQPSNRACYIPSQDTVQLPERKQFPTAGAFYSTAFHEAGHATGHEARLDRLTGEHLGAFGSEVYSREELVAEFAAAILCGLCGVDPSGVEFQQSASYLANWAKKLEEDPDVVFQAAGRAQKAVDYLLENAKRHGVKVPRLEEAKAESAPEVAQEAAA